MTDTECLDWILSELAAGRSIVFDPKWLHPLGATEHIKLGLREAIGDAIRRQNEQK